MPARFIFSVLALFTSQFASAGVETPAENCVNTLGMANVDPHADVNERAARPLDLQLLREFPAGGSRWMAAHLTKGGRTLLASLDQRNLLRVFDVDEDTEQAVDAPTEDPGVVYTRGEWIEGPAGELAVALGDQDGFMPWYGVEPRLTRGLHASDTGKPIVPLATVTEDGEVWILVSSGERLYRVRVLPAPSRTHEYRQLNTETRFLRAARFRDSLARELIAAISRRAIEVFDLDGEHARYRDDLHDGNLAWTTWFEDVDHEPVLVATDDHLLHLHVPLKMRPALKLPLGARAAGRVHALATAAGSAFILVPTENGAEVYRYHGGRAVLWTKLPTAVSAHQKGIFKGPNDRAYAVWTEEPAGRVPRLNVGKLARVMGTPEYAMDLGASERVHHVQVLNVTRGHQLLFIKTSSRVIVLGPRAFSN